MDTVEIVLREADCLRTDIVHVDGKATAQADASHHEEELAGL